MRVTREDYEASEAARALVARRWGNRVVVRAAETVIERADELPDELWVALAAARDGGDAA